MNTEQLLTKIREFASNNYCSCEGRIHDPENLMENLLKECDKWEEEANEESRGKDKCQSQEELMVKELKDNLQDEYIEGDDKLTRKLREFWFSSSPFVGMGGRDFLLALRDFIRDFIEKEAKEK